MLISLVFQKTVCGRAILDSEQGVPSWPDSRDRDGSNTDRGPELLPPSPTGRPRLRPTFTPFPGSTAAPPLSAAASAASIAATKTPTTLPTTAAGSSTSCLLPNFPNRCRFRAFSPQVSQRTVTAATTATAGGELLLDTIRRGRLADTCPNAWVRGLLWQPPVQELIGEDADGAESRGDSSGDGGVPASSGESQGAGEELPTGSGEEQSPSPTEGFLAPQRTPQVAETKDSSEVGDVHDGSASATIGGEPQEQESVRCVLWGGVLLLFCSSGERGMWCGFLLYVLNLSSPDE